MHQAARTPAALGALLIAVAVAGCDDRPTEPSVPLATRYALVSIDGRPLPAIADTTELGERLLTSGSITFTAIAIGGDVNTSALRGLSFEATVQDNGVPAWVAGEQMMTGVHQSGRRVVFSIPLTPGPDARYVPLDTAHVDADGRLVLRAGLRGIGPSGKQYELVYEPTDDLAGGR